MIVQLTHEFLSATATNKQTMKKKLRKKTKQKGVGKGGEWAQRTKQEMNLTVTMNSTPNPLHPRVRGAPSEPLIP